MGNTVIDKELRMSLTAENMQLFAGMKEFTVRMTYKINI